MNDLGLTVVWCAIQATLIAVVCGLLCFRPLRLHGPTVPLTGLATIMLVTLLAFAPLPSWWQVAAWVWPELSDNALSPTSLAPESVDTAAPTVTTSDPHKPAPLPHTAWREFADQWMQELSRSDTVSDHPTRRWPAWVALLFLVGLAWGATQLIVGLILVHQCRRRSRAIADPALLQQVDVLRAALGCTPKVELRESLELATAATLGWWQPLVLLPAHWRKWSTAERNAVLAHELAHIHRGDYVAQLVSQLGLAMHYLNPAVHWLVGRLRLEQELSADADAARLVGGPQGYVRILAALALENSDRTVGWPARHFLPTRRTFLRRIEMLRDAKNLPRSNSSARRVVVVALIGLAALLAVGLRGPDRSAAALGQVPPAKAATPAAANSGYDIRYVADNGGIVIAVQPSTLLSNPKLRELTPLLDESSPWARFKTQLGVSIADVEQIVMCQNPPQHSVFIRLRKPIDATAREAVIKSIIDGQNGARQSYGGSEFIEFNADPQTRLALWQPDNRSLVIGSRANVERFIDGRVGSRELLASDTWKRLSARPFVLLAKAQAIQAMFAPPTAGPQPPGPQAHFNQMLTGLLGPVLTESRDFGLAASINDQVTLEVTAQCLDEKGAQSVQDTVRSLIVLGGNTAKQARGQVAQAPAGQQPLLTALLGVADQMVAAAKVEKSGPVVTATSQASLADVKAGPIAQAILAARGAAQRAQGFNNLKQIGLAFHNFHASTGHFPSSANLETPGPNGTTKKHTHPHSWRVAMLPYIEQQSLYNQYNFDEPWDSENNLKVLKQMPAVYRHASAPPDSTNSSYFVLTGPETIFDGKSDPQLANILDGTSNTILAVEAKREIPWTKPEDIAVQPGPVPPVIEGYSPDGFSIAMADGSARFLDKAMDAKLLKALMTARGKEVIPGF